MKTAATSARNKARPSRPLARRRRPCYNFNNFSEHGSSTPPRNEKHEPAHHLPQPNKVDVFVRQCYPCSAGLFNEVALMKTKKNTAGRKATTTADNSVSEYERKHPTGVTPGQRKERAGRFAALAEKIVAKMNGHDRALLDAAAEAVETTAAALVAWQLTEERGLGKRRDDEAMFNRWNDDTYEAQSTLRRNNHEREVAGSTAAVFGMFGSAGLTDAEQVEVVRRFFRNGDHSLAEAEGRAIKAALAMPSPNDAEPITYADNGEAITIRIGGTAYANLATMARAMNGVAWCEHDNTPATVASNFVIGDTIEDLAEPTQMSGKFVCGGCGEIALEIADAIDTGCDSETNEHKRRVKELRTALLAALPTARETSGANT